MINKSTLAALIQGCMNRWSFETPTADNVTQLSLSSNALEEVNNPVVTNVGSLPDLTVWNSPDSVLVFVQNLGVYAISSQLRWITLDGRLLRDDAPGPGQAWSWGANGTGQLGEGTNTTRSSPGSVVGSFTDWCQISGGSAHTVAVRTGGSAWAWGQGGAGQLGNCAGSNINSPVSVVGITDWCQVAGGNEFSSGIRSNKTAWAWGTNGVGQLGDGTTANRSSPVSVAGGFTDWCQISAGGGHNVAVRTNGSAWAWGFGANGRLGDNTALNKSSPVSVVGGITDWCQASAMCSSVVAVRSSGSVWAWGSNIAGQLGDATGTTRSSPVSVVGGFTDWCQVGAGRDHTVAIRTGGGAWAWGCNNLGRLGDGTATDRTSPVIVVGGFTDWCQANGGACHSMAVRTSGLVWTWGANSSGQLGDNATTDRSSPVSVIGGFTDWFAVSVGMQGSHTLAIRGPIL